HELRESARRATEIGLEDALELQQGLIVESDIRKVAHAHAARVETIRDRVLWKTLVTLLPCESLFLGSGDDLTIAQQTCGAVVVERRYPEYELRCHWQPLIRRWSESSSRSRNAASRRPRSRHRAGKTQTVTRRAITGCKRSSSGVRDRARGTVMLRCYHSNARSPLRRGAIARLSIVTSRARIRICSRGMSAT